MGKMKIDSTIFVDYEHEKEEFDVSLSEEAHYVHTMNAFVELIVVYGYDKVIGDLRAAMAEKTW